MIHESKMQCHWINGDNCMSPVDACGSLALALALEALLLALALALPPLSIASFVSCTWHQMVPSPKDESMAATSVINQTSALASSSASHRTDSDNQKNPILHCYCYRLKTTAWAGHYDYDWSIYLSVWCLQLRLKTLKTRSCDLLKKSSLDSGRTKQLNLIHIELDTGPKIPAKVVPQSPCRRWLCVGAAVLEPEEEGHHLCYLQVQDPRQPEVRNH